MAAKKKLPPVLEILRDNIVKHNNPLALKPSEVSTWNKELQLPKKGNILFYTGGEYQLLPYIDSLVKTLTYVDSSSNMFSWLMEARKIVNMTGINAEKIYASILAKDKKRYFSINYKAAYILKELGYDLCYNDEELYSGALLYELGFWNDLNNYAQRIAESLRKSEAKTVVCISPHAAEMFKQIYPQILPDFPEVEVKTFIELVWEKRHKLPKLSSDAPVVIHDSCRMARELGISHEIREILEAVDVGYVEPFRSKEWTTCCGGPSKMLFPEISKTVATRRVVELTDTGSNKALISCPYCLSALQSGIDKNSSMVLEDIVEFLYRGFEQ